MTVTQRPYTPAAGRDWLLPFYDLFTRLAGITAFHRRLLDQAAIQSGSRVLEIGCGTGNLAILAKRLNPSAEVVGIDPDPKALARARKKARRGRFSMEFRQAFTEQLPFPEASFDRVLSAFMLHHIQPASKLTALREVHRVLEPGGSLHLADFEQAEHPRGRNLAMLPHQHKDSALHSGISELMQDAGFVDAREVSHQTSVLGRIAFYAAVRPPMTSSDSA